MILYLYTKIPLLLFAIKKEEEIREEIIVYNIHFLVYWLTKVIYFS